MNPVAASISDVVQITTGSYTTYALKNDGTVWAWGNNEYGQLGANFTSTQSAEPIQIADLYNVVFISAGNQSVIALTDQGEIFGWGDNHEGLFCNNEFEYSSSPVKIERLKNISTVSIGNHHALYVNAEGEVYGCGRNHLGELGNGSDGFMKDSIIPVRAGMLENITIVNAGHSHSMSLNKDGLAHIWGNNIFGQVGTGGFTDWVITPVNSVALSDIIFISSGDYHSFAIDQNYGLWAWGRNHSGELGLEHFNNINIVTQVKGIENVIEVDGSYSHSVALTQENNVYTWGLNTYGQLGNGKSGLVRSPRKVTEISNE